MGQEDYLNNLLNSLVESEDDTNETTDKKKHNLSAQEDEYDNFVQDSDSDDNLFDYLDGISNQTDGVIRNERDEELIGNLFANEEEEAIGDLFANEEEEAIGDLFINEEEEAIGDLFANEEEEAIGDLFANEEEEVIGDLFANEEEEEIGDLFATEEEEPLGDLFASEEESLSDKLLNTNETNDMDNLLSGIESINFDDENLINGEEMNYLEEMESNGNDQDTDDQLDDDDIFRMFNTGEERVTPFTLEETDDGPMDSKSLFDEDLMKLLGEEDFSMEDSTLGSDEEEMLQALKDGNRANSVTKAEKKDEEGGLFSKLFKKSSDSNSAKSISEENDESEKELNEKDKKKKDKEEKKAKSKKEKKPKKEKTPKKKKQPKPIVIEEPTPPLHKGSVIAIFILFLSIGAFIILGAKIIPYSINLNNAQRFYEREQYELAFNEMQGLSVKEKDLSFYRKLKLVMILNNQLNEYQTFDTLSLKPEALDSLLKGIAKYDEFYAEAQQYGIEGKYDVILEQITNELSNKYGVSIDTARTMNALATREEYSAQVYNITK